MQNNARTRNITSNSKEIHMKERTLTFNQSKKLSVEEVESVSAAGWTTYMTAHGSYTNGIWDTSADITLDF